MEDKSKYDLDATDIINVEDDLIKKVNSKKTKGIIAFVAIILSIIVIYCLFELCYKIYQMDPTKYHIIGYSSMVIALILYLCLLIIPIVKIVSKPHFITYTTADVNLNRSIRKHNKKLRTSLAKNIVELSHNPTIDKAGWYLDTKDSNKVALAVSNLEVALDKKDDKAVILNLRDLYNGKIKKSAMKIINKSALNASLYSAVSQSNTQDTLIVTMINLQMIKDLVFLYGFRPDDKELLKIFSAVLRNAFISYGISSATTTLGKAVGKTVGDAAKGIPFLGGVVATLVDSASQGAVNGILTNLLGRKTIKYLLRDYNAAAAIEQDVADCEITEAEAQYLDDELKKDAANFKKNKSIA